MKITKNKRRLAFILLGALCLFLAGCIFGERIPYKPPPKKLTMYFASFWPDDNLVLVNIKSTKLRGICLMTLQGKVVRCLRKYDEKNSIISIASSPDGKIIAYTAYKNGNHHGIFLMDANGGNVRRLLPHSEYWDYDPQFSADGKGVFFIRHMNPDCWGGIDPPCSEDQDIYYAPVKGGKEIRITQEKFDHLDGWRVLPGNRYIVLSNRDYAHKGHPLAKFDILHPKKPVYIVPDLSKYTSDPRATLFDVRQDYVDIKDFTLNRDGRYLVFSWDDPSKPLWVKGQWVKTQIYLMDMKTMHTTRLTNFKNVWGVDAVSNDGKKILFYMGKAPKDHGQTVFPKTLLWIINSDGTGLRNIPLDFSAVADQFPLTKPAAGTAK